MPTINTNDLTGAALDWAVATAEGIGFTVRRGYPALTKHFDPAGPADEFDAAANKMYVRLHYSTDPVLGHAIVEREGIGLGKNAPPPSPYAWEAGEDNDIYYGPTALVAAMRCYVASKLGQAVDVPQELAP